MKKLTRLLSFILGSVCATGAYAALNPLPNQAGDLTGPFLVNFTCNGAGACGSENWQDTGEGTQASTTESSYGGFTVTASTSSGTLFWDTSDHYGLGIKSSGNTNNDEIDTTESLLISFNNPQTLSGFIVGDFWAINPSGTLDGTGTVQVTLSDNSTQSFNFIATDDRTGGENPSSALNDGYLKYLFGTNLNVKSLAFSIEGDATNRANTDYVVSALYGTAPVPVPPAIVFFVSGLLGLFGFRNKQPN